MKLRLFTSALALAGMAAPAFAQSSEPEVFIEEMITVEPGEWVDGEEERLKREILREVDKRMAKQLDALRRDIRKMLAQRQAQGQQRSHSAPRAPQAPRPPMAPAAPGTRREHTYYTTPDGRRVVVRKQQLDARRAAELRAKAEHARKNAMKQRAEAMKKSAYLKQHQQGGKPQLRWVAKKGEPNRQTLRMRSHANSADGHAKIRIEVNGKVIEKVIPLGESFELNLPGGKVWVRTDAQGNHSSRSRQSAKKFAHKEMRRSDSKRDSKRAKSRDFDFDFDFSGGDRDEMRRKLERFLKENGGRGAFRLDEKQMKQFGKQMEEWGKKFEHDMEGRAKRAHREGRALEFELKELKGELPEMHAQLKKMMSQLSPEERREVERAMKELHGIFGEMGGKNSHKLQKANKSPKRAKSKKSKQSKKSKKSKRQMEEESF